MDEEEVKRRKVLYEMEDELWALIKRKAWIGGVILAVVGFGGIWATVHYAVQQVADAPLRDLQKQLVQAEMQADSARRANAAASAAAEQVAAGISSLQGSIQGLKDQAKGVEDKFVLVSQQIDAASKNSALRSQRDFVAVQERIAALEVLVKRMGEDNAATRQAASEYAKQVAALESKVEREQKRFAENSTFSITVLYAEDKRPLALEVQRRLASAGYRVVVFDLPQKAEKNTLTYDERNEARAKEIASLLAPSLKDVELRRREIKKSPDYKASGPVVGPLMWTAVDPNSFTISVGG